MRIIREQRALAERRHAVDDLQVALDLQPFPWALCNAGPKRGELCEL